MKKLLGVIGGTGAAALLAFIISKMNSKSDSSDGDSVETVEPVEPEKYFHGVSLSELNKLAEQISRGISCSIDQWGFLVFNYLSRRGHQIFHDQMSIDENGKLKNLGSHYPNQWRSQANEFAEEANRKFDFDAD